MAIGDVYQVKSVGSIRGQQMLNIWFFRDDTGNVSSSDLATVFDQTVIEDVRAALTSDAVFDSLEVYNLFDPLDFTTRAVNKAGVFEPPGEEELPQWFAASIRLNRQRVDMRHGYKRFAGIHEEAVWGDAWKASNSQKQALDDLALAMNYMLDTNSDGTPDAIHVVVKRIKYTTPGGATAYRLPENSSELEFYDVQTATLLRPTTQLTRKA